MVDCTDPASGLFKQGLVPHVADNNFLSAQ